MRFFGHEVTPRGDRVPLALIIWICILPVLLLVVLPLFGASITLVVALVLFLVLLCWALFFF